MPSKPELAGAPLVPAGPPVPATSLQHFWQTEALRGVFYPETFGAIGDGVAPDHDALQDAIDAAIAVQGTVQLGLKQYAFDSDLTLRKGKVTLRGRGWWCNIQQQYDEEVDGSKNLYTRYRTSPSATDPHFHTSGSVLLARNCNGLTRQDGAEGGIASNITLESFALVGDSTTDKTGLLLGGPTFTRATANNIVRNVFVGHFAVGIDLAVNYFTNVEYCSVRGCKEAVTLGVRSDTETGQGANANYVRGCEFDSNNVVIAAYEGVRNHFSDLLAQNNDVLLYVRPTGISVRDCVLTDIYWESLRPGNRLFQLDDAHATQNNLKAAMRLSFERINMQGGNAGVPDFGTGGGGWSAVIEPVFHDVDVVTSPGTIVVPVWVRAPRWKGGRWPALQVNSARKALIQVQCNLYQGSIPADGYVTDVTDGI